MTPRWTAAEHRARAEDHLWEADPRTGWRRAFLHALLALVHAHLAALPHQETPDAR